MIFVLILVLIFSNQYLLFNEELFIIAAFFALCYIVKSNLGGIVESELFDRKNKIISNYLDFLKKKSSFFRKNVTTLEQKVSYVFHYTKIQSLYYSKFEDLLTLNQLQVLSELSKSVESSFIFYFAGLVSKKRKFL